MLFQRAVGVIAIVAAVATLYLGSITRSETLRLEMPKVVEIGDITAGSVKSVDVEIHNPCRFPIEILDVSGTCSCTEIKLSHSVLKPRESGVLEIHVAGSEKGVESTIVIMFHAVKSSQVASQAIVVQGIAPDATRSNDVGK